MHRLVIAVVVVFVVVFVRLNHTSRMICVSSRSYAKRDVWLMKRGRNLLLINRRLRIVVSFYGISYLRVINFIDIMSVIFFGHVSYLYIYIYRGLSKEIFFSTLITEFNNVICGLLQSNIIYFYSRSFYLLRCLLHTRTVCNHS